MTDSGRMIKISSTNKSVHRIVSNIHATAPPYYPFSQVYAQLCSLPPSRLHLQIQTSLFLQVPRHHHTSLHPLYIITPEYILVHPLHHQPYALPHSTTPSFSQLTVHYQYKLRAITTVSQSKVVTYNIHPLHLHQHMHPPTLQHQHYTTQPPTPHPYTTHPLTSTSNTATNSTTTSTTCHPL